MFLASFASGLWQANCYVVAATGSSRCVVIDPGQDAAPLLAEVLDEHQLVPEAVLATHGHFDHVADAAVFADAHGIPVWIHPADRHLLSDPASGLSDDGAAMVRGLLGGPLAEPATVESLDRSSLTLAGLEFTLTPAPGHTRGSVLLGLAYPGHPQLSRIVFTGDVVFAGSVGRTDLPGGDQAVMVTTLRDVVSALPDDTALLPGHGPQTVMATERAQNPYLQPAFLRN
ncbi:MAG: MBL fold metallo-hydrolase [Propionicimonas sp.]